MNRLTLALFLGAALAPQVAAAETDDSVAGFWQQVDNDGKLGPWFYFAEVDGLYEGRLVKISKQPGEKEKPNQVCSKCEGKQKDAPILGLTIVKKMHRDGLKYEDGTILDPRDGKVYHARMDMSPDGQQLSVRGYIGIPLLGQTQVWTRLPDDAIPVEKIPKDSVGPAAAAQ